MFFGMLQKEIYLIVTKIIFNRILRCKTIYFLSEIGVFLKKDDW